MAVSVQDLLKSGLIVAKSAALSVVSQGKTRYADLAQNGEILFEVSRLWRSPKISGISFAKLSTTGILTVLLQDDQGVSHLFQTPSAFSLYVLRLDTPKRQSSAGWRDVIYEGRPLGFYRDRLAVSTVSCIIDCVELLHMCRIIVVLLSQTYSIFCRTKRVI